MSKNDIVKEYRIKKLKKEIDKALYKLKVIIIDINKTMERTLEQKDMNKVVVNLCLNKWNEVNLFMEDVDIIQNKYKNDIIVFFDNKPYLPQIIEFLVNKVYKENQNLLK